MTRKYLNCEKKGKRIGIDKHTGTMEGTVYDVLLLGEKIIKDSKSIGKGKHHYENYVGSTMTKSQKDKLVNKLKKKYKCK